eukprot:442602_1
MCLTKTNESSTTTTCSDRISMTLAPCLYLDEPDIAYNDCCLLQHENKNGLSLYVPPLIEIGGTYLNLANPIHSCWILLRMFISIYFVSVILFTSFIYYTYYQFHFIFIYFTHWTVICACIYTITALISSILIHKHYEQPYEYHVESLIGTKIYYIYAINKILLQISLPSLSLITFNFWVMCDQIPVSELTPSTQLEYISTYQLYLYVLIAALIDFIFSTQKLYYKSAFWSVLFFTIWTVFNILYDMLGGQNEFGQPFIFDTVDWSQQTIIPLFKYMYSVLMLILFNTLWTFSKNLILTTKVQKINTYMSSSMDLESDDSELDQILL